MKEQRNGRTTVSFLLHLSLCVLVGGCGVKQASHFYDAKVEVSSKDIGSSEIDDGVSEPVDVKEDDIDPSSCLGFGPEGECLPLPTQVKECVDGWCLIQAIELSTPQLDGLTCSGDYSDWYSIHDRATLTGKYDLLVSQFETTQGEWQAVMGNKPSFHSECGDDCPVERVNWFDAALYCNRLSTQHGLDECYRLAGCTGLQGSGCAPGESQCLGDYRCQGVEAKTRSKCNGYRIPTEDEWMFYAMAGTQWATYNGEIGNCHMCAHEPVLDDIAWYCHNSDGKTHGVGQKAPNPWQLYDVLGNVMEWNEGQSFGEDEEGNIVPDWEFGGPFSAYVRGVRGGSWWLSPRFASVHRRLLMEARERHRQTGFRVVRTLR